MGSDSKKAKLLNWIVEIGINGAGFLPSAQEVAEHHLKMCGTEEEAINSVIAWRTAYAAGTGFVTGLGGLFVLPITISASLAASYAIAANTVAAIAILRGYDIRSDQVRTFIFLSLVGDLSKEVLKDVGINAGTKITKQLISQIPGKVLIEINKKVGFRLITKAGQTGIVNLMKVVPLVGGVIGAGIDSTFVKRAGKAAKLSFQTQTLLVEAKQVEIEEKLNIEIEKQLDMKDQEEELDFKEIYYLKEFRTTIYILFFISLGFISLFLLPLWINVFIFSGLIYMSFTYIRENYS